LGLFENKDGADLCIQYKTPDTILLYENHDVKMSIEFQLIPPTMSLVQKEMTIKQEIYIIIEAKTNKSIDELLNILSSFQKYLSIAMMSPTSVSNLDGESLSKVYHFNDVLIYGKITIILKSKDYFKNEIEMLPHHMIFTIHDMADNVENYLTNWFNNFPKLGPVIDLFFRAMFIYGEYLEEQIRCLAIAIEAYHKRFIGSINKYDLIIINIIESFPDNLLIKITERINIDNFAKNAAKMRHKLAHLDKDIENVFPLDIILGFRNKFIIILYILILNNIGFSYDRIYFMLDRRGILKNNL